VAKQLINTRKAMIIIFCNLLGIVVLAALPEKALYDA
jgi:hypothetical protein